MKPGTNEPEMAHDGETIARVLNRAKHQPLRLTLTLLEQATLARLARDAVRRWPANDPEGQVALATELATLIESTMPRLARFLIRLRYEEQTEAVIVHGLPAQESVAPLISLTLSCMFGVPFNYREQLGGELAMRIEPKAGSAPNTNTTRDEFAPHTDDAAMAPELRVTWITLYGVRNPPHTLTGYAPIRAALAGLTLADLEPLWQLNYLIRMPLSFNLGADVWSGPRAVLSLDELSLVNVAWPTYATRLVDPTNIDAAMALQRLHDRVLANMVFVPLMPGTFFAFNNARGLHMRTPIGPGQRLVLRTYVRPDLDELRRKSGLNGHVFPLSSLI